MRLVTESTGVVYDLGQPEQTKMNLIVDSSYGVKTLTLSNNKGKVMMVRINEDQEKVLREFIRRTHAKKEK